SAARRVRPDSPWPTTVSSRWRIDSAKRRPPSCCRVGGGLHDLQGGGTGGPLTARSVARAVARREGRRRARRRQLAPALRESHDRGRDDGRDDLAAVPRPRRAVLPTPDRYRRVQLSDPRSPPGNVI